MIALLAMLGALLLVEPATTVERSSEAVRVFRQHHICPATQAMTPKCPGYVVDHIVPLACHGLDHESNMQYQTIVDGKAKDRWEILAFCRSTGNID